MASDSLGKQSMVSRPAAIRFVAQRVVREPGRVADKRRVGLPFLLRCGLCPTGQSEAGIGVEPERVSYRTLRPDGFTKDGGRVHVYGLRARPTRTFFPGRPFVGTLYPARQHPPVAANDGYAKRRQCFLLPSWISSRRLTGGFDTRPESKTLCPGRQHHYHAAY